MTTEKYIKSIEKIIEENQQIQMLNPPTSKAWREASKEINRLAKLIIEARKGEGAMDIKVRIHAARQEMNQAHNPASITGGHKVRPCEQRSSVYTLNINGGVPIRYIYL